MTSFATCLSLATFAFAITSCNGDTDQPKCQDKNINNDDYEEANSLLMWFCAYDSKVRSESCYANELYNYMQPKTSGFLNFNDMRSNMCHGKDLQEDNEEVTKVTCDIADKVKEDGGVWKIIKNLDPQNKCHNFL